MLVKHSIVEKWYQRNSWIYKNFSYLFSNPLWEKNVPQGFTVCPYLWMSLFSFFIFRPLFVAPIQYLFRPLIRLGGKPVAGLDHLLYKLFDWMGLGHDKGYKQGYGYLFSIITPIFVALVLAAIGFWGYLVLQIHASLDTTNQGVFLFWSSVSFASLFGIIKLHQKLTKTECKTMYYLLVWLILFVPAIFIFIPHEAAEIFGGIAVATGHGLATVGLAIWHGICLLGWGLWAGISWLVLWKPVNALLLPWWGYFVIMTIVGWLSDKFYTYYDTRHTEYVLKTNPKEIYEVYREAWVNLFARLLCSSPYWGGDGKKDPGLDAVTDDVHVFRACKSYRLVLYREAFAVMWKNALNKLEKNYPTLPKGLWDKVTNKDWSTDSRFEAFRNALLETYPDLPEWNSRLFAKTLKDVISKDNVVLQLANHYKMTYEQERARHEAKKKAWSHLMCLKVTGWLATGVNSVNRGFKSAGSNIATFFVYMWMLIKAKKQGACPYFRFSDPTPAPVVTTTENNQPK